jgi:uncharacterized cupredoxin-like copper-binding protein
MTFKMLATLAALVLVLGACGGSGNDGGNDATGGHEGHSGDTRDSGASTQGEVPGSPADPSEADTEILVTASDELKFDPASVRVEPGDVVTFVVRNTGKTDHEFVLGDEDYQNSHEEEMSEGHDMADMENAVTVAAGETKELTWEFTEAGSVLFGCHEPGHYEAGMVGTVEVG